MNHDLTKGPILKSILSFTLPLLIGNIMQQAYNLVDTYVVGKALGSTALAAVGSSYSLMTFIISIITGLCMGSSALVSIYFGKQEFDTLRKRMSTSFLFIGITSILLEIFCLSNTQFLLQLLHTPAEVLIEMKTYLGIIFYGILFLFFFNYFAYMSRARGNSITPLFFLSISTLVNIVCDFLFVFTFQMGIAGAAYATILAQFLSALGMSIYYIYKEKFFPLIITWEGTKEIFSNSLGASVQQSIMNFGILMIQSLVNTFGASVMAAFAIGVKIDTLAYMPVQEFGNAFSTFVGQNYGAKQYNRIQEGIKKAIQMIVGFSLLSSLLIFTCSSSLISIFTSDMEVIRIGSEYLRIEGSFYIGIGILFFFYGYYRAIKKPMMSIVLTIFSLGTRVLLSYWLAPKLGYSIIWFAIVLGWLIADLYGYFYFRKHPLT
ncbi:MAG: MATE family efflux transporter [Bacillota bacterium]|nr:MATE family efflux transporter [Bacillota bacterium]